MLYGEAGVGVLRALKPVGRRHPWWRQRHRCRFPRTPASPTSSRDVDLYSNDTSSSADSLASSAARGHLGVSALLVEDVVGDDDAE